MKKILLKRRDVSENGILMKQAKITPEIVSFNTDLQNMQTGWQNLDPPDDEGNCPPNTLTYYYIKIGGECVKVPY